MSKSTRRLLASALVAMVALVSLLAMAGSAAAQLAQPDSLVGGTITGATSGTISIVQGTTTCSLKGGSTGAVSATGTYLVSVNCPNAGATNVVLNGAVVATFNLVPGTRNTANGQVGAAPTATTPPGTATVPPAGTPAPPKTGMASEDSSSSAWLLVIAGLGALALGVGGVTAVRKSR